MRSIDRVVSRSLGTYKRLKMVPPALIEEIVRNTMEELMEFGDQLQVSDIEEAWVCEVCGRFFSPSTPTGGVEDGTFCKDCCEEGACGDSDDDGGEDDSYNRGDCATCFHASAVSRRHAAKLDRLLKSAGANPALQTKNLR